MNESPEIEQLCAERDALRDDMHATAKVFNLDDTISFESLPDYVRRQVAKITTARDALRKELLKVKSAFEKNEEQWITRENELLNIIEHGKDSA